MTTTISEEAVKAAIAAHNKYYDDLAIYPSEEPTPEGAFHAALKGALPFLSALEPSATRELALEDCDLQELLERLDAGLEYEGWMETDGAPVELFDIGAAQDLFADAVAAIRALSSPDHADAGKVEGDGWKPGCDRLPTLQEAAFAAKVLNACNGYDLSVWTDDLWPCDDASEGIRAIIAHSVLPSALSEGAE